MTTPHKGHPLGKIQPLGKIRLEDLMSADDKRETGFKKLSSAERQALNHFCNEHFDEMQKQRGGQGPKPNTPVVPPG
jgi:hypothetical protein